MVDGKIEPDVVIDFGNRLVTLATGLPQPSQTELRGSQSDSVDNGATETADELRSALNFMKVVLTNKGEFAITTAQKFAETDNNVGSLLG